MYVSGDIYLDSVSAIQTSALKAFSFKVSLNHLYFQIKWFNIMAMRRVQECSPAVYFSLPH